MKKLFIGAIFSLLFSWVSMPSASALGLKVAPLDYTVSLRKGEKQKGFIDLSNPSGVTVRVKSSVQAFKQINNKGTLQFFDDEQVSAGVIPDLEEFELGPREAVRMYFLVDGTKLPSGDVFAAIFFTTQPTTQGRGVTELVRLGTILSIVNGTPGERSAEIARLDVPFWQFGDSIKGSYVVKNTADPKKNTGFYPTVVIAAEPFRQELVHRSRLVFAGLSRENQFELKGGRLGFYEVAVSYGEHTKKQWVFMFNGASALVFLIIAGAVILTGVLRWKKTRKKAVDNLRINR